MCVPKALTFFLGGYGGPQRSGRLLLVARTAGIMILLAIVLALPGQAAPADPLPQRIVSLAPSVTETLFALGLGPRVVGVSQRSDFPPEARQIKKVGSFLAPSVEVIVAQRPDLVIAVPSPGNREAVTAIERMGIRVQVVRVGSLAETREAIRAIGNVTGADSKAQRLIRGIDDQLERVGRRLAGAERKRVLLVVGRNPLVVAGPRSFLGELLERAHGLNIAPTGSRWPVVNVETVIAADPEVIIDTSMGSELDDGKAASRFWSSFPSLRAVRTKRVVSCSSDRLLRPGPRLAEGVLELARLIHPERF